MQTPLFSTVAAERQVKISLWKTTSNPLTATELLRPCSLCMVTWVLWLTTCLTHMHLYVRLFSVSNLSLMCDIFSIFYLTVTPSSDIQGQIVGARESRDGQKKKWAKKIRAKVKAFTFALDFSSLTFLFALPDFPSPHYLLLCVRGCSNAKVEQNVDSGIY